MNRTATAALLTLALYGASPAALADAGEDARLFSWARYGTQGFGAGGGYALNESFAVRVGANTGGTFTGSRRIDDNRYDIRRKTSHSFDALVDWYPRVQHGVRFTGGLVYADTRTALTARPSADGHYVLDGTRYAADELGTLSSDVRPARLSPYLGVGWESSTPRKRGVRFFADAGVMHLRSRRASLVAATGPDSEEFRRDLAAEEGRVKAVNDFAVGASIGASYSF